LERFRSRAVIGIFCRRATQTFGEFNNSVGMCSRTRPKDGFLLKCNEIAGNLKRRERKRKRRR
jgi:hypothetical protein